MHDRLVSRSIDALHQCFLIYILLHLLKHGGQGCKFLSVCLFIHVLMSTLNQSTNSKPIQLISLQCSFISGFQAGLTFSSYPMFLCSYFSLLFF